MHILNYLRSTSASHEGPEVLPPRAAKVGLEGLLELRDEAAYLGLDGLHKLCVEEIRQRRPRSTRGHSAAYSMHSLHASVSGLQTMREGVERHSRSVSKDSADEMGHRSPPTPESWAGRRVRSQPRNGTVRSPPPAGWI